MELRHSETVYKFEEETNVLSMLFVICIDKADIHMNRSELMTARKRFYKANEEAFNAL